MIEQIQSAAHTVSALSELGESISGLLMTSVSVIGAASIVAKYLPPPENPGFLSRVHKFINQLAMNSGYAENKEKSK